MADQPTSQPVSLTANDLASRRKIGKRGSDDAWLLETKGGYNVVVSTDPRGNPTVLGCGPHPAVATFLAEKAHGDLVVTQLAKCEKPTPAEMRQMLPGARRMLAILQSAGS
jgi:hypothetical protein